jgi:transposase-like protein
MDLRHPECPVRFRRLASGSKAADEPQFSCLKGETITPEEKQFLCEELDDGAPGLHKFLGLTSVLMAATRYGISRSSLRKWVKIYVDPHKTFHEFAYRPPAVADETMQRVKKAVMEAQGNNKPPNSVELTKKINLARDTDYRSRGLIAPLNPLD